MLIFVVGIQSTPVEVMEAATVDGASYFRRVTRVLIPMIANAFTVSLFLTIVNSFKLFDLNVALTKGGRPRASWGRRSTPASCSR